MRLRPYLIITFFVLISTAVIWLPFLLKLTFIGAIPVKLPGLLTLYANYDGPLYVIPAKYGYSPDVLDKLNLGGLSGTYFAAHLPGYPLLIAVFGSIVGYLPGMLFVTLCSSVALGIVFYELVRRCHLSKHPLIITLVMLMFPRLLIVRSVGAPETLYMGLIMLAILFFEKKQYMGAGIVGALACIVKVPSVLLFPAFGLVIVERLIRTHKIERGWVYLLLIPLGLLGVFGWYHYAMGDFFAYFHTSAVVPMPFPYAVFNYAAQWVGTAWLEDIVFILGLYTFTVVTLWRSQYRSFFYFTGVFLVATLFVEHRDLSRYLLPLWPFVVLTFPQFFSSKRTLLVVFLLLPAIYLYSWNFIAMNTMPITEWFIFR